jgi:hypothetical protein
MPQIAVNLGDVAAWESLPFGKYLGEITATKYIEAKAADKFPQIQVTYLVIEGDSTGKSQSQWLSLSPKAIRFTKRFFDKFGLGETANFDVDDDTDDLLDPDIIGYRVIFEVAPDRKDPDRIRTDLVSVEEDAPAPAPAPAPVRAARPARPAPAAQPAPEEVTDEEDAESDEAEAEAPVAEAAPVRRAPARPVAAAPRQAPQRRTLR